MFCSFNLTIGVASCMDCLNDIARTSEAFIPVQSERQIRESLKRAWTNTMLAYLNNDHFMFNTFLAESLYYCKNQIEENGTAGAEQHSNSSSFGSSVIGKTPAVSPFKPSKSS